MTLKQHGFAPLGIIAGVLLGVLLAKTLDHWPAPVMAGGSGKKAASEQAEIFRNAAKAIGPAVVNVTTRKRVKIREGGGLSMDAHGQLYNARPNIREEMYPRGKGSGFIFDKDNGYVLTNNHVVAEGDSWVVQLADKRMVEAKLVGTDPQTDVAVLKITASELVAANLGDSDSLEVGDWVLAVGNPFGHFDQTVTAGIISAKGRRGMGLADYTDYLQTDAAINRGNSGGPLVDLDGEVVGINTAIFSESGGYQGVGFSIPINTARKIALKLVKGGTVIRGWMGIEVQALSPADIKLLNLSDSGGLQVNDVYLGSPAVKAGILPEDILLTIDGKSVRSPEDVRCAIADMEPGVIVPIVIMRKIEKKMDKKTLRLTVGAQPKNWETYKNRGD